MIVALNRGDLGSQQRRANSSHDTGAWMRSKIVDSRNHEVSRLGLADDQPRQQMLASTLSNRRDPKQFRFRARGQRDEFGQRELAARQRPRFVEGDRIDSSQALERGRTFDDNAMASQPGHGRNDRGGRRENQRARAGNHQDGERGTNGVAPIPRDQPPGEECQQGRPEHKRKENPSQAIGGALERSFLLRGLRDELHDFCQRRFGSDFSCHNAERAELIECAREDLAARLFINGQTLPGEGTLVDSRDPGHDGAVDRHAFAGSNRHRFAFANLVDRDIDFPTAPHHVGHVGAKIENAADR